MPVATSNICSVVALGADDRSISVWQTKSARPLIVAKEAFERQIMDLSWSADGLVLYAVSSDGTLAALAFDKDELEGIAPAAAQRQYLSKFGFSLPAVPNGYSHPITETAANGRATSPSAVPLTPPSAQQQHGFGHSAPSRPGEQVTQLVARRAPKNRDRDRARRRVQPTLVGSLGTKANVPSASTTPIPTQLPPPPQPASIHTNMPSSTFFPPSASVSSTSFGFGASSAGYDGMDVENINDFGPDMSVPISALDIRGRRSRSDTITVSFGDEAGKQPRARTLGGDRARDSGEREVREIRRSVVDALGLRNVSGPSSSFIPEAGYGGLSTPTLKTFLSERVAETGDTFEARNSEDGNGESATDSIRSGLLTLSLSEPSEITFFSSKEKTVQWLDYLPMPVLAIRASNKFCAAAMEDGSINVYSLTGRR